MKLKSVKQVKNWLGEEQARLKQRQSDSLSYEERTSLEGSLIIVRKLLGLIK